MFVDSSTNCHLLLKSKFRFIFDVASWHSNSGPHQENHKIRIMHVPTLSSQAHKTWPTKCCSQNVIKRKLWRPALCC